MPHYSDGTEAKLGDLVLGITHAWDSKSPMAGYVVQVTPGSDTCNAYVATIRPVEHSCGEPLLNMGPSGSDHHNFKPKVELANCKDLALLHRKAEPVAGTEG